MIGNTADNSPLGRHTQYQSQYDAALLFPIARAAKWEALGLNGASLPFTGSDTWNGQELSWLNSKGKPVVMAGTFKLPCDSPYIIESKSFKLYLNGFNQTRFHSVEQVLQRMTQDLSVAAGAPVIVELISLAELTRQGLDSAPGTCLDELDVAVDTYTPEPAFLQADPGKVVTETLHSHLLKSNCPVTGQPDWGTVVVDYTGPALDRAGLLAYLCSFRQHQDFHEQCVERIFVDVKRLCRAEQLTVYARYVRRGGLDINPWRSDCGKEDNNRRLARQ